MTKLRQLPANIPDRRIGVASTLATLIATSMLLVTPALLALVTVTFMAPTSALAAEDLGGGAMPELPAGLSPEQTDMIRKMLQSNAEARKSLEAAQQKKKAADAEAEAVKKDLAAKAEPAAAALPRYDWRTSAYVGPLFANRLSPQERDSLTHFGHELFAPTPGAALLLENIPVAPGYIVGPGDEIVVKMWGRVEGTHRMVVDRDGKIFLPKFGSLYVAGKTFEEMRAFLKAKVSTIAEVSSDVTLGQMKGIRVSVVGEVRAPGWYNVSSLHTALQALSIAGGMKDIGSMRRIKILRAGKAVREIDLYEFLLSGDTRADIRLLQGDVIFVPVVGKLTAIAGEVRRPSIYELRDEKSLLDLVKVAGGFAPSAFKQRVQVERLEGNVARIVLDTNAENLEAGKEPFPLSDGDIVRVLPIVLADENVVTVEGNVYRPGKYEIKPGMTVGSLLPDEKVFLSDTYFDYALLTRLVPPDLHKEIIPVNLREIVLEKKSEADIPLHPRDTLTVFNRSAFRDTRKATISGEVRRPGTFELKKGSRVSDLVKLAGDLTKLSWLPQAEVIRIDEKTRTFRTIYFDLGKAMAGDEKENLALEDEDQIVVRRIPEWAEKIVVTLSGEVRFPGEYAARKGERLSSVIAQAGGYTKDAYLKAAIFTRVSTQKTQQEAIDKLIEDLELEVARKGQQVAGVLDKEDVEANKELVASRRALIEQLKKIRAKGRVIIRLADDGKFAGSQGDVLLEDGDRLDVPRKLNVINVVGRVYNPTGIVFDPARDSVGYYLRMVGGPTETADRDHIFLLKADGTVVTRETADTGFFAFGERGLMSAKVEPGDSILVPEKLIQTRFMKDVKDITQILYQIAVTAGVLIVAF